MMTSTFELAQDESPMFESDAALREAIAQDPLWLDHVLQSGATTEEAVSEAQPEHEQQWHAFRHRPR